MVVVAMVAVIVTVVVVVEVLVRTAAIIGIIVVGKALFIDVLTDAEIIEVGIIVIALKFAFTESYSVRAPSDVGVGLFMMNASVDVLLADVTANAFTGIIAAVGCPVSTEL